MQLPRGARKEIDRVLGKGPRADDVALALSVGADAIDAERVDVALEVLTWAKHEATRVAVVREALGVARYLEGDFAGALTELQAYRRISGRVDQNHLIADALRGLGRELDRVIEPLEELLADDGVSDDRRAEAIIIWAATLADHDDLAGARALLRRHLARKGDDGVGHELRVHVLAADLAERDGDHETARHHRRVVARAAPELIEVAESDASPHEMVPEAGASEDSSQEAGAETAAAETSPTSSSRPSGDVPPSTEPRPDADDEEAPSEHRGQQGRLFDL